MEFFKSLVLVTLLCLLVFWLRTKPFREKKTKAPEKAAHATLLDRRVESGTNHSGRSSGMGYSYVLTFRTESGKQLELYAYDVEYGALREGMVGSLTWRGPYFVSFQEEVS